MKDYLEILFALPYHDALMVKDLSTGQVLVLEHATLRLNSRSFDADFRTAAELNELPRRASMKVELSFRFHAHEYRLPTAKELVLLEQVRRLTGLTGT